MGCASSTGPRRSSKVTINSLDSELGEQQVQKRYGHPSYYKTDGYEIGLRVSIKGTSQSTFVGTSKVNNTKVTIKEHHLTNSAEADVTDEIKLIAKFSHECLPKLKEVFITNISIFTVTDFIDSMRLKHFIDVRNNTTTLKVPDIRKIVTSILNAVSYCHDQKVIIRHLTADNIMIKNNGKDNFDVKICDFSLAVPAGSLKVLCDHPLFEWNDVPFLAPEALLGHPYSFAMDVWSVGVLLFVMASGYLPFESPDDKELVEKIKFASYKFDKTLPVWAAPENEKLKLLIGELLVANSNDRPQAKELLKHGWILNTQQ